MPVAAALGLLALLGTEGKNTNLGAHFFGFVFGTGRGLAAEHLVGRYERPGRWLNTLLALDCTMMMVSAWRAAAGACRLNALFIGIIKETHAFLTFAGILPLCLMWIFVNDGMHRGCGGSNNDEHD